MSLPIDQSVYPDFDNPPATLETPEEKADYVHRICSAWDFGVHPEPATFDLFADWREVFDQFPIVTSPAYHAFRSWFRWPAMDVPPGLHAMTPRWGSSRPAGRPPARSVRGDGLSSAPNSVALAPRVRTFLDP